MGFPLDRYGMLSQLAEAQNHNESFAGLDLNRFKAFVLVLHDPNNRKMVEKLQEDFCNMDYISGRDMLFLTWIAPPEKWLQKNGRNRTYYEFDREGLLFGQKSSRLERNLELLEMRRKYKICDNTSALVIFQELMSQKCLIVGTDPDIIEDQMRCIGQFCYENCDDGSDENGRLSSLENYLKAKMAEKEAEMANLLLDVLSLSSSIKMPSEDNSRRNDRADLILRTAGEIVRRKIESRKDAGDDILHLYDLYAMHNHGSPTHRRDHPRLFEETETCIGEKFPGLVLELPGFECQSRLEENTLTYLDTYNMWVQVMHNPAFSSLDLSALIIYLAKILECESNSSLYQYVRKVNDIPMPEYYNKFCPYVSNQLDVSFNVNNRPYSCPINRYVHTTANNRSLEPRTLGELQKLVQWMQINDTTLESPEHNLGISDYHKWYNLTVLRNNAAHSGRVTSINDYQRAFNLCNGIIQESLYSLLRMKECCIKGR